MNGWSHKFTRDRLTGKPYQRHERPNNDSVASNVTENYKRNAHLDVERSSGSGETTTFVNQSFHYHTSVSPYDTLVLSDPCFPDGTCEFTQTKMEEQYCNCDEKCHQYKDCCHDIKLNEDLNSVYTPYYQCYKSSKNIYKGLFAVAECPAMEENTTVSHLCRSNDMLNTGPCVVHDEVIFKNRYCALCHNITSYKTFDLQFIGADTRNIPENISRTNKLSYFFQNSIGYQLIPPNGTVVRPCMLGLATNNDALCQMFINPMQVNNECTDLETYTNFRLTVETFYLVSSMTMTKEQFLSIIGTYIWSFTQVVENLDIHSTRILFPKKEKSKASEIRLEVMITKPSFIDEIRTVQYNVNNFMWKMVFAYENNTSVITKEQDLPTSLQNESLIIINNDIIKYTIINLNRNIIERSGHLDCNRMTVIAEQNTSLNLHVKDIVCHEYHIKKDLGDIKGLSYSIKAILTYACFSISVVALVFSVTMNRKYKLSSTVAGSNMENLSISLIASNILFMIGSYASQITYVCYTIGVFLHYLWLSVFSFMMITVLYIAKNLTSMKSGNKTIKQAGTETRRVLTVIGLMIPLLFVAPVVILDQFNIANLSVGYGNSVCFPNIYPANLIFFTGPVVVSTVINCVVLFRVIFQVCLFRMEMRHLLKSSSFQDAKLFLRLAILSGIFWVTGLLSGIFESEWLQYIFILLCGLQGCFICIANLTTRYMYSNVKTIFSKKSSSPQTVD
ncbi:unnamed protein product [Mytilus edulis]|uniref:G-protein coupled receptors family 2 profile 2 domain-containing protein n=1 Tax=Mytilus edulis TaxID=6550 RepID=A0A8S3V4E9_MYTED|nr:unnamed protein product [Mytilus edulis]